MNTPPDPDEQRLRDLVHQAGEANEQGAPSFQRVWNAAHRAREESSVPFWRLRSVRALAAAAMVALISVSGFLLRPARQAPGFAGLDDPDSVAGEMFLAAADAPLATDFLLSSWPETPSTAVETLAREISALLEP